MLRQGAGKNNSRRCILMNKIIDFEKVSEQCRSSRPANPEGRSGRRKKMKTRGPSERMHTHDVLTLLTAVRLIVTSCRDISFSVRLHPERLRQDDLYTMKWKDSPGHYTARSTVGQIYCAVCCGYPFGS